MGGLSSCGVVDLLELKNDDRLKAGRWFSRFLKRKTPFPRAGESSGAARILEKIRGGATGGG